jgi:hypothetical protein
MGHETAITCITVSTPIYLGRTIDNNPTIYRMIAVGLAEYVNSMRVIRCRLNVDTLEALKTKLLYVLQL